MIFCHRGWVRVVYEDQGPPFVLEAGDCVLQPPGIRHRVLESSPGLEVIEVSCPAEHETRVDHDLSLPTDGENPGRDFGGQRFARHVAASGTWTDGWRDGFQARPTGIAEATRGLAAVQTVRRAGEGVSTPEAAHEGEFLFLFVRQGEFGLRAGGRPDKRLSAGDAVVVPAGMSFALTNCSRDLELLEVCLPARLEAT
jgi:mannose-6-phosphate isomerase-like protein (cupin superfamily)